MVYTDRVRRAQTLVAATMALAAMCGVASADLGKPVAVRFWGQALVTIETYWNLRIAIDPYALRIGYGDPGLQADLVLVTHDHADHANVDLIRGTPEPPTVVRGLDSRGQVRAIDLVLDRLPGADRPEVADAPAARSPQGVRVRSIASDHDATGGTVRGHNAMFLVEADGVRILHCGDLGQRTLSKAQLAAIGEVDVMLVPVGGVFTVDGAGAAALIRQVRPRLVVPIHYGTAALTIPLEPVDPFLEALGSSCDIVRSAGNTLAVSAGLGPDRSRPRVTVLSAKPWEMPGDLASLFERREQAIAEAAAVIRPLSAAQLNHRPSDGTHTPRWNAEHVMAADLGFFTAIYAGVDPAFPHLDLAPAQMPDDYAAAHADWAGAEEARQVERAAALVRRFAYLLDGIALEDRPAGSNWTLRGLLEQMARHTAQHAANVRKKFALPDWPKE